jgi:hypothetical protein
MDLSRFPLLAQQHSWINSLQNLANRPLAEAEALISTDPMVKMGRLIFELHAWMVDNNILP